MSWLDTLLQGYRIVASGGTALAVRGTLNFVSGATVADNPTTGQTDVTVVGAAPPPLSGDVGGTIGANTVISLTGATGTTTVFSPNLQFDISATNPTISQQAQATVPQAMVIQAANVGTGAGSPLNLTSGSGSTAYGPVALVGHANVGFFTQAMGDAPQTISAANSIKNMILCTGNNTGIRALTLTRPPTAGAMVIVRNNCTGFGVTVQFSSGSATATIVTGTSALIAGDGTNAVIMMSGA